MTIGGLFEGIGGFALAAQWAGITPVWSNEIDPFCCKVLRHNFTHKIIEDDIRNVKNLEPTTIISGGFPCQPFSQAGLRRGKDDDRYLWTEMLRIIQEVQPTWVVGENVFGITNWNEGLVFEEVCADLEAEGYEVQPYVLPAAAVNAPHRRDRVWFIAYSRSNGRKQSEKSKEIDNKRIREGMAEGYESNTQRNVGSTSNTISSGYGGCTEKTGSDQSKQVRRMAENIGYDRTEVRSETERCSTTSTNTIGTKLQGSIINGSIREEGEIKTESRQFSGSVCSKWENFPTEPPICGRNDGLPKELDSISFPKWRNESIKAYGNAIVPQVAYEIFMTIIAYEKENNIYL